jgi:hypothetical protein
VKVGFFPLDRQLQLGDHSWTPDTLQKMARLSVEIPSYARAVECFRDVTNLPISKSSLQRIVVKYGTQLVDIQAAEAAATIEPPPPFDEDSFRRVPEPDSALMAVSMDGAFINIRGEGWKEVKVATVSAVVREPAVDEGGEPEVKLVKHSYRAGLWDAATFGPQQWAEACRRGIEKAKDIVTINDGALWIWAIVAMCYAPCVEILDWWHAVEKLWTIANLLFGQGNEVGKAWVHRHKDFFWAGHLRPLFHFIRTSCPRGQPLPDGLRQAVGYFYANRHRMRYRAFRQAGYPIGSGSVESGCKEVAEARLKQAGMRWSRTGAQAMLALRAVLLSDRWNQVWPTVEQGSRAA